MVPDYIKGEPQAMVRKDPPTTKTNAAGDNCWMVEQRHVLDPITFFDFVVRYKTYDDYFFYVMLLVFFGLLLM